MVKTKNKRRPSGRRGRTRENDAYRHSPPERWLRRTGWVDKAAGARATVGGPGWALSVYGCAVGAALPPTDRPGDIWCDPVQRRLVPLHT